VSIAALEAKWSARLVEWRELGVTVLGEKIAREILDDLRAVGESTHDEAALYGPSEAGVIVDYHPGSITRLIKQGKVRNYGSKHRPLVKLSELPRKATRNAAGAMRPVRLSSDAERSTQALVLDASASRLGRSTSATSS